VLVALVACSTQGANTSTQTPTKVETFVLASTTSTQDSGFLDAVGPVFEKAYPKYRIKVVAVGSGEALNLGRKGDADVLLVHSPDDEVKFMDEGYGLWRKLVMRNDFVIVGPKSDPAAAALITSAAAAFGKIAAAQSPFVSRGDQSGTHKKELKLWAAAAVTPSGSWYLSSGQGMAETLRITSEKRAYTLTDTATFSAVAKTVDLAIVFAGDPALKNPYSVIPLKNAQHQAAGLTFANWIISPAGQRFIYGFGRKQYGKALFIPAE
jgi:tungstate transport system substrate-binding protein